MSRYRDGTVVYDAYSIFEKPKGQVDFSGLIQEAKDVCDPLAGFPTCAEAYAVMSTFNNYEV